MSESNVRIYEKLIGKTFKEVKNNNDNEIHFIGDEGSYKFYHEQDCCEYVRVEDICGDLKDLENEPITMAEEYYEHKNLEDGESCTYTFYKFATKNGYVDIRWFGESNGYYSESVDFKEL